MPRSASAHSALRRFRGSGQRGPDIDALDIVDAYTSEKQLHYTTKLFLSWLKDAGIGSSLDELALVPALLDKLLRKWGVHMYDGGQHLYLLTNVIVTIWLSSSCT